MVELVTGAVALLGVGWIGLHTTALTTSALVVAAILVTGQSANVAQRQCARRDRTPRADRMKWDARAVTRSIGHPFARRSAGDETASSTLELFYDLVFASQ